MNRMFQQSHRIFVALTLAAFLAVQVAPVLSCLHSRSVMLVDGQHRLLIVTTTPAVKQNLWGGCWIGSRLPFLAVFLPG